MMANRRSSPAFGAALRLPIASVSLYVTQAIAADLPSATVQAQQAPAAGEARQSFNIPAGSLDSVIDRFDDQIGIRISVNSAITQGLNSPGVKGDYTTVEALRALLAGTGVTYRFTGPAAVTLERAVAQTAGATMLGTVKVIGTAESAVGPVEGYRAVRSATGTKTDTPLIETPQSISVITQDRLEERP